MEFTESYFLSFPFYSVKSLRVLNRISLSNHSITEIPLFLYALKSSLYFTVMIIFFMKYIHRGRRLKAYIQNLEILDELLTNMLKLAYGEHL